MISRVTLGLFLLALVIPSGIALWSSGHRDSCSRYLAGDRSLPATQMIQAGDRAIEVPCEQWLVRQPLMVQVFCLLEGVVVFVMGVNLFGDVVEARRVGDRTE